MAHFTDAFMQIESTDTLVWREYEPRRPLSALDRLSAETDLYAEIHAAGEAHGGLFVIHYLNGASVTLSYPRGTCHVDGVLPTHRIERTEASEALLAERALLPMTLPTLKLV